MEKEFILKTSDGFTIPCVLNSKKKSNSVIILVHGLTGHMTEHQFKSAVPYFNTHGFDTLRFDFYHSYSKGRILSQSSISTHILDLGVVVDFFAKRYKKVYLVGHSLGGPVICLSNLSKISAVVLWDPTMRIVSAIDKSIRYEKSLGKYIMNWGVEYILSKEMVEEWRELDNERMARSLHKPTKIISAGEGALAPVWKEYLKLIPAKHDMVTIKGANHCFDEEGKTELLFKETLKWVKRY